MRTSQRETAGRPFGEETMPLRELTEAVILQSIEDLSSSRDGRESVEFFRGKGFRWWAEIAA